MWPRSVPDGTIKNMSSCTTHGQMPVSCKMNEAPETQGSIKQVRCKSTQSGEFHFYNEDKHRQSASMLCKGAVTVILGAGQGSGLGPGGPGAVLFPDLGLGSRGAFSL